MLQISSNFNASKDSICYKNQVTLTPPRVSRLVFAGTSLDTLLFSGPDIIDGRKIDKYSTHTPPITRNRFIVCVCVCVCVCVLSSQLFWTSGLWTHQPGSHTGKVTKDFSTFLMRCLPYFVLREGFSRPFPSSTVKSNFVYPRNNRSPLVGYDARKNLQK